jgi:hypothetical protein
MKKKFLIFMIILSITGCTLNSNKKSIFVEDRDIPPNAIILPESSSIPSSTIISTSNVSNVTNIIKRPKVENRKLKRIMRKFDDLLFTKLNLEAKEGEEDLFFGKDIKAQLKEFVSDTKKIIPLYPEADEEYIRLAKALNKQAYKLYRIVQVKKTEWVEPQVENIITICNQCHTIYQ